MRERLIGLIQDSGDGCTRHWAEVIADYLLENGVVVPPCKVGDKVYHIKEKTIFVMPVKWFETNNYGWCACCVYPPMATFTFKFEDFGKTVFLTREEAERALRKEDEGK